MTPENRATIKARINQRVRSLQAPPKGVITPGASWVAIPLQVLYHRGTYNRKGLDQ